MQITLTENSEVQWVLILTELEIKQLPFSYFPYPERFPCNLKKIQEPNCNYPVYYKTKRSEA